VKVANELQFLKGFQFMRLRTCLLKRAVLDCINNYNKLNQRTAYLLSAFQE
jgi:hypothetical protein